MNYLQIVLLYLIAAFLLLLIVSLICDAIKEVARIKAGIPPQQKNQP